MFEETPGGTTTAHILTNFKSKLKRLLLLSINCLWIHLFMNFSSHCEVFECSLDKQHRVPWVLSVNTEIEREISKDIEALGTAYTNFCNALEKTENTGVLWKSIPKPTVSVITASTEEGESTTIHHMNCQWRLHDHKMQNPHEQWEFERIVHVQLNNTFNLLLCSG